MIWNRTKECMDQEEMSHLQRCRLIKLVERAYHDLPYYRSKMQEASVSPYDIESLGDIEKLPFTTKADLRENYPYGTFAKPMSEIVRLHASSGTTGKATVVGYTRKDIEIWKECISRVLAMASIGKEDVVQVSYGYGLFTGGLGLHYGVENTGATAVPMSTASTSKQTTLMKDLGATAICCTPSYLLHIIEELEEEGTLNEIKLKAAICGGEPWSDEMRDQIESKLNITCHDIYGLSEIMGPGVAADCKHHTGLHIQEDMFYPEIIDPESLRPLPDGEVGELVITTLNKEAMPMVRYRTGDLTSLSREKCLCGRTTARISRFVGRTDDMLVIKGVNVFPSQVEAALVSMGLDSPYYQIVVDRAGTMDTFSVHLEVDEDILSDEIKKVESYRKRIMKGLMDALGLRVDVRLIEPRSIERTSGKSKKVIDKRKF